MNRSDLYNLMHRSQDAIACAQQAFERFSRLGSSWGQAIAQRCMAEAYIHLRELDAAEQAAQHVLALEDEHTRPDALRVLAEVFLLRNDPAMAEAYAQAAIESAQESKNDYLQGYGYRTLATIYQAQHQPQQAQHAFAEALRLFTALGLPTEIADTQHLMADAATSQTAQ
ncbi:MAG: tetratricopeptide repeat protein [Chloroflexaceae bacterium]|nr:tetratricopeptide repeat protein [Chloroflexaceae bacterium]